MNREDILKQAIEKAVKNGWKHEPFLYADMETPEKFRGYLCKNLSETEYYKQFIFDHSFCKAFAKYIYKNKLWDKLDFFPDYIRDRDNVYVDIIKKNFQTELVHAEDRLKYISRFL